MPWELALSVTFALVILVGALALWLPKNRTRSGNGFFLESDLLQEYPDTQWHFVLFSSNFCARCPAVRRVLTEIADGNRHAAWSEINLSDHIEIAKQYQILRTPTVFLLDGNGSILMRYSGELTKSLLESELHTQPETESQEKRSHVDH